MNLLAIDYGQKRIGLAFRPTDVAVVLPCGLIRYESEQEAITEIQKKVQTYNIEKIIIGLPITPEGSEGAQTTNVRSFATELGRAVSVPIIFFDERYSTHEAGRMEGNVSLDERAAMILLRAYLD